ncbi:glycosyltransferase [Stygiolobus caldivivus]|uniref:Glycosyltransferase 2-like domain-containing protein n=1 Tax=Stygiolobus caldivivus TaxID=2824673 RepID=A0A8D5U4E3_9CREN|nr:glycosyltransferase [Stygiolobus caldivivus]BCU69063.1 hypothetical protein KN1_03600 [Stygiolobus caldivivus]
MQIMISVITVDFRRQKYIIDAVTSALNQTLNRSEYEIIVAKAYNNDYIDKFLEENGVISVTEVKPLNRSFIAKAIDIAKGEILCFLDDDDLFLSEKLETVLNYFSKYENLGYIKHANYGFINNDIPTRIPKEKNYNEIYIKNCEKKKKFTELMRYQPDGNSSSICIRRDAITKYSNLLREINYGIDSFYFYSALASEYDLLVTPKILALRRYHSENTTAIFPTDFESWLEKRKKFVQGYISSLEIIRKKIADQKPFSDYLARQISLHRIYLSMLPGSEVKPKFVDYIEWIKMYKKDIKGWIAALVTISSENIKMKYIMRQYEKELRSVNS